MTLTQRISRRTSAIWKKESCWQRALFPPIRRDMAELEIHTEHEVDKDPVGKKVGILASVLAVFLAIVTIASHRAHTAAILSKTNANDQWNLYQANRLKAHNLEVGRDVISILAKDEGVAGKRMKENETGIQKYEDRGKETQEAAKKFEEETDRVDAK